jgi:hypothetical protein
MDNAFEDLLGEATDAVEPSKPKGAIRGWLNITASRCHTVLPRKEVGVPREPDLKQERWQTGSMRGRKDPVPHLLAILAVPRGDPVNGERSSG